jgi:hypothetical protein
VIEATISRKHVVPFDPARAAARAREIIAILGRGSHTRRLTDGDLADLRHVGEELWRTLLHPTVQGELRRQSGSLLIELDESLVALPWELLYDGQQFLCRRFAVGRTVRSSEPRRGEERRAVGTPIRVLVLACDPRGDLAEVQREGEAIARELELHRTVRARLMSAPDCETICRQLKDYDVVHFAGHADYVRASPGSSGWHLADGKLTGDQIAGLAGGRPMPMVVFSNACQSGVAEEWGAPDGSGDSQRAYGLAGAFLLAGVRHYVGTQWEVVDGHSAVFATEFYKDLSLGQSIGAALQHARDAVVQRGGERQLAWASYVLYGDPDARPLTRPEQRRALSIPSAAKIAARASAPWKRPLPQTESGLAAPGVPRSGGTLRPALIGAGVGLLVTAVVAVALFQVRSRPAPNLALLGVRAASENHRDAATRLEACLEGALGGGPAPLVPSSQVAALQRTARAVELDDARAQDLGRALGARFVLYGSVGEVAELRLRDVGRDRQLTVDRVDLDDLPARCAAEAQRIQGLLSR